MIKFWIFIFSWNIIIENNTAKGIFKLFIIAKFEGLTWIAPLFHRKKPTPVGIKAKYKIENICIKFMELHTIKTLFTIQNGNTNNVAPKYALAIYFKETSSIYFFHKTCPNANEQLQVSINKTPLIIISKLIFCHTIIPAPKIENNIHKT